jgi:hypothetical protein
MAASDRSDKQTEAQTIWSPGETALDSVFHRIDLIAIFITAAGLGLLGITAAITVIIEIVKLSAGLWSNPVDRWIFAVMGLAIAWLVVRWKRI